MPYLVTTRREIQVPAPFGGRRFVEHSFRRAYGALPDEVAFVVPEEFPNTTTLPDGTVIEVERVERGVLWEGIPATRAGRVGMTDAEIVDAYNAAQDKSLAP